jgi:hypothetical protein
MAIRVYADTSVYGGVFDLGIDQASKEFFEQVKQGRFQLVVAEPVYLGVGSCYFDIGQRFQGSDR